MSKTLRVRALGMAVAALGAAAAQAQPGKPHRGTPARPARQAAQGSLGFTFGDVTLRGYSEMKFVPGRSVVAEGPSTTVESIDRETGLKSQLTARKITATMGKGYGVDKVEAIGSARFSGSRPQSGGTQIFNGSGSKATYYKQQGRLVVDGPVAYYAEQPVEGQPAKQWVRGTASEAIYEEKARTLTLNGSVKAKAFDPETMPPGQPADIIADKVIIDMTKSPYEYRILNNDPNAGQIRVPIRQQPKREPEKKP